jgi:hypothetical protein
MGRTKDELRQNIKPLLRNTKATINNVAGAAAALARLQAVSNYIIVL